MIAPEVPGTIGECRLGHGYGSRTQIIARVQDLAAGRTSGHQLISGVVLAAIRAFEVGQIAIHGRSNLFFPIRRTISLDARFLPVAACSLISAPNRRQIGTNATRSRQIGDLLRLCLDVPPSRPTGYMGKCIAAGIDAVVIEYQEGHTLGHRLGVPLSRRLTMLAWPRTGRIS